MYYLKENLGRLSLPSENSFKKLVNSITEGFNPSKPLSVITKKEAKDLGLEIISSSEKLKELNSSFFSENEEFEGFEITQSFLNEYVIINGNNRGLASEIAGIIPAFVELQELDLESLKFVALRDNLDNELINKLSKFESFKLGLNLIRNMPDKKQRNTLDKLFNNLGGKAYTVQKGLYCIQKGLEEDYVIEKITYKKACEINKLKKANKEKIKNILENGTEKRISSVKSEDIISLSDYSENENLRKLFLNLSDKNQYSQLETEELIDCFENSFIELENMKTFLGNKKLEKSFSEFLEKIEEEENKKEKDNKE